MRSQWRTRKSGPKKGSPFVLQMKHHENCIGILCDALDATSSSLSSFAKNNARKRKQDFRQALFAAVYLCTYVCTSSVTSKRQSSYWPSSTITTLAPYILGLFLRVSVTGTSNRRRNQKDPVAKSAHISGCLSECLNEKLMNEWECEWICWGGNDVFLKENRSITSSQPFLGRLIAVASRIPTNHNSSRNYWTLFEVALRET